MHDTLRPCIRDQVRKVERTAAWLENRERPLKFVIIQEKGLGTRTLKFDGKGRLTRLTNWSAYDILRWHENTLTTRSPTRINLVRCLKTCPNQTRLTFQFRSETVRRVSFGQIILEERSRYLRMFWWEENWSVPRNVGENTRRQLPRMNYYLVQRRRLRGDRDADTTRRVYPWPGMRATKARLIPRRLQTIISDRSYIRTRPSFPGACIFFHAFRSLLGASESAVRVTFFPSHQCADFHFISFAICFVYRSVINNSWQFGGVVNHRRYLVLLNST